MAWTEAREWSVIAQYCRPRSSMCRAISSSVPRPSLLVGPTGAVDGLSLGDGDRLPGGDRAQRGLPRARGLVIARERVHEDRAVELPVDAIAVGVDVLPIGDIDVALHHTFVFAAVGRVSVQVDPAGQALREHAEARVAATVRVGVQSLVPAAAAVAGVGLKIERLVHGAIAVVVEAVTARLAG